MLYMILHLNVRDNSDNMTLVTNTRMHAAFHKAL